MGCSFCLIVCLDKLASAVGDEAMRLSAELDRVNTRYISGGGLHYKSRCKSLLSRLGFEEHMHGAILQNDGTHVAVDGKVITAIGMGAAVEFGLTLVAALKGQEAATALKNAVFA